MGQVLLYAWRPVVVPGGGVCLRTRFESRPHLEVVGALKLFIATKYSRPFLWRGALRSRYALHKLRVHVGWYSPTVQGYLADKKSLPRRTLQ